MPYKTCSCGRDFTKKEWQKLKFVGVQDTVDEEHFYRLELRNCPTCRSTIGVEKKLKLEDAPKR